MKIVLSGEVVCTIIILHRFHCHKINHTHWLDKLVFFDVIIEDDSGDTEPPEEKIPYQLTKEGVYMEMQTKDLMVRS